MRYRTLGTGGPEVSAVCFGTWAAGGNDWGPVDDGEVIAALRRAPDLGITFFDTADVYGWGHSEDLVGAAFDGRTEGLVIATKLGITKRGVDLSPAHVVGACEVSLRRLRAERIDLYQIHWPGDPNTPIEETWEAMCRLQDAGKVGWIGVSNFDLPRLESCEKIRHVQSVQNEYSMLVRDPETEGVLAWCVEHGTALLSYGSLAYGILTGKFDAGAKFPKSDWRSGSGGGGYYDQLFAPPVFGDNLARVARLREVAAGIGATVGQLAVAWLLREPAVASAICGARRPSQIEETAAGGDITLDAGTLAAIEEILTGPTAGMP